MKFVIFSDKEMQKMFAVGKPESENVWYFCLENNFNQSFTVLCVRETLIQNTPQNVIMFKQNYISRKLVKLAYHTPDTYQLAFGLCPHHMQLAALQCEPPVNCTVRLGEGDDSNDNDDVEDDG